MAKLTTEEFIAKAKAVHGDRYDYSKVEYVNNQTKVCIICKEHGEFWQAPYTHLNGHGCPKCAYKGDRQRHIYSQEEIIDKIRSLFGERYSFEKVIYKAMKVPIILVCHEKDETALSMASFLCVQSISSQVIKSAPNVPKRIELGSSENLLKSLLKRQIRFMAVYMNITKSTT